MITDMFGRTAIAQDPNDTPDDMTTFFQVFSPDTLRLALRHDLKEREGLLYEIHLLRVPFRHLGSTLCIKSLI